MRAGLVALSGRQSDVELPENVGVRLWADGREKRVAGLDQRLQGRLGLVAGPGVEHDQVEGELAVVRLGEHLERRHPQEERVALDILGRRGHVVAVGP